MECFNVTNSTKIQCIAWNGARPIHGHLRHLATMEGSLFPESRGIINTKYCCEINISAYEAGRLSLKSIPNIYMKFNYV